MKISEILWLEQILDKVQTKHGLLPEEVEEVFFNRPLYRYVERGKVEGEDVYSAYGRTDAGRYVTVIFI